MWKPENHNILITAV